MKSTKNAIFIWIPKTAGTSVWTALKENYGCPKLKLPEQWPKFKQSGILTFSHVSIPGLRAKGFISDEFYNSSFKFCFVRNPFDRMVSLYHYLMKDKIIKQGISFKKFCKMVHDDPNPIGLYNVKRKSQAQPQVKWLVPEMDFIGRFENLQSDFDKILTRLELAPVELPHTRVSKNRKPTKAYYDKKTISLVRKIYKADFETFGYSEEL